MSREKREPKSRPLARAALGLFLASAEQAGGLRAPEREDDVDDHLGCHTHLVQSAVVLSAMLPKGRRVATWKAMVCLEKASSVTPHLRRPNTSRPKHNPTRRAKNPAGARASPRGFKKYGSWPRPSLPQTLRG